MNANGCASRTGSPNPAAAFASQCVSGRQRKVALRACLRLALVLLLTPVTQLARAGEPAYQPDSYSVPTTPRVGVGFAGNLPTFDLQCPDTKSEVSGRLVGMLGLSWMRDLWEGEPDAPDAPPVMLPIVGGIPEIRSAWICGRMAFAPIGVAAGSIYGQFAGVSEAKLNHALPSITNTMMQVQIPEGFERLILLILREQVPGIVLLTNHLPHEATFPTASLIGTVAPIPQEWREVRRARSVTNAFEGTDVVVLLRVVNWGLSGRTGHNPPLSVSIQMKGTLINARTRDCGRSFYASYESSKRPFAAWAANGGQPFREELWRGIESIARQMALEIPPPPPTPSVMIGGGGGG